MACLIPGPVHFVQPTWSAHAHNNMVLRCFLAVVAAGALPLPVWSGEPEKSPPDRVKVAAVQMLGYDKTDLPRPDCDPTETVIRYVRRSGGRSRS